ncbi:MULTISPECIES: hypothetical protein [Microbacterium]|nr:MULTISPECIES: hypothetical protein [Microbacterium]AMG83628.1 hypothetical protein AXH82_09720 [Microbacterium sp. PAMC 28756]OSP09381.1 hypothetical protein B7W94_01920 [Microbacterium sp. LEMMJ01]QXE30498.1 hypothetical protein IZR02_03025 [Microbacterium paraoxydans]
MLQISSGMYFESDNPHETVHRRVLYSNGIRVRADDVELPIGTLRFSTGHGDVRGLQIEVIDRLERTNADGSDSIHIATGGDELVADAAAVVAFGLDVVVLQDQDLTGRVIAGGGSGLRRREKLLAHVLEPARFISDSEIDGLRSFCDQLIALQRPYFESAMRAVRRIVDAVTLSSSDVALSYTLFVAALESLAKDWPAPEAPWSDYEPKKRKIVDAACEELDTTNRTKVQEAVLAIDRLALRRRFQGFVLDHLAPSFFRSEASDARDPIRAVDLPKALDFAYVVRSKTMHELRDLAPELRELPGHGETIWHDGKTVLSLEGLHRICQHVVRQYVERAPRGVDPEFNSSYRSAIPGIVRVRMAPEYWITGFDNFGTSEAPRVFSVLVESLRSTGAGESEGVIDMRTPIRRLGALLRNGSKPADRLALVASIVLWNGWVADELRITEFNETVESHAKLLEAATMYAYALWALGGSIEWSGADLESLAEQREADLKQQGKRLLELPVIFDAVLHLDLAQRASIGGNQERALVHLSKAVELLPGDPELIELESQTAAQGIMPPIDLRALILRTDRAAPQT